MDTGLELCFLGGDRPELSESRFTHPCLERPRCCVRGKQPGVFLECGTFQWTRAVRAMCLLILRCKAGTGGTGDGLRCGHVLSGGAGTPAVSLDDALHKQTGWLQDMFGLDGEGRPLGPRLFLRSSSGRRGRSAPVSVMLNPCFIDIGDIDVRRDGRLLEAGGDFAALAESIVL